MRLFRHLRAPPQTEEEIGLPYTGTCSAQAVSSGTQAALSLPPAEATRVQGTGPSDPRREPTSSAPSDDEDYRRHASRDRWRAQESPDPADPEERCEALPAIRGSRARAIHYRK